MPDFFVPLDTTQYTTYHRQISARGIIISSSLKYVDQNRKQLKKEYSSFDDFNARFEVPESLMRELYDEAEKANVKPKDDEQQRSERMLKVQLKALIARDIWDMNQYFQIINEENHIVRKALQLLGE